MGMRVRLKGSYDISSSHRMPGDLKALKTHGMIVATTARWFITRARSALDDGGMNTLKK